MANFFFCGGHSNEASINDWLRSVCLSFRSFDVQTAAVIGYAALIQTGQTKDSGRKNKVKVKIKMIRTGKAILDESLLQMGEGKRIRQWVGI